MGKENVGRTATWEVQTMDPGVKDTRTGVIRAYVPRGVSATAELRQRVPAAEASRIPKGIKDKSAADRYVVLVPQGPTGTGRPRKPLVYLPVATTVDNALFLADRKEAPGGRA